MCIKKHKTLDLSLWVFHKLLSNHAVLSQDGKLPIKSSPEYKKAMSALEPDIIKYRHT